MDDVFKDFTLVIPIRIDSEDRKENLLTLLRWISDWGCSVLVLEAAEQSVMSEQMKMFAPWVQYIYVQDKKAIFHRTYYINMLLQKASTRLVGVWDSDVIILKNEVIRACLKVKSQPQTLAYPYDGRFIMHSKKNSLRFRQSLDLSVFESEKQSCLGRPSCGGAFIIDKIHYWEAGAENERFIGWGPEDAERLRRCQILGWNVQWVGKEAVHHLFHPQRIGVCKEHEENLCAMRKELLYECSLTSSELKTHIEETYTWVYK